MASNNESFVINALQFIGVIDDQGKSTSVGSDLFHTHKDEEFQKALRPLIQTAYKDLFDLHGDRAWQLSRVDLIQFFRRTDKTSEIIGARQAGVFKVFASLSGFEDAANSEKKIAPKRRERVLQPPPARKIKENKPDKAAEKPGDDVRSKDVALTVRIEVNLPSAGTKDTYDNIFRSMKENLIN